MTKLHKFKALLMIRRKTGLEKNWISSKLREKKWIISINLSKKTYAIMTFQKMGRILREHFRTSRTSVIIRNILHDYCVKKIELFATEWLQKQKYQINESCWLIHLHFLNPSNLDLYSIAKLEMVHKLEIYMNTYKIVLV